jgi:hypothetical protein
VALTAAAAAVRAQVLLRWQLHHLSLAALVLLLLALLAVALQ